MSAAPAGTVSRLLRAWGHGDKQAREDLLPLVYQELRRRASAYLRRERPDHTLQPTALVHEAYIRLTAQTTCELVESRPVLRGCRTAHAPHPRRLRARAAGGQASGRHPRDVRRRSTSGSASRLRGPHAGRCAARSRAPRSTAGRNRRTEVLRRALGDGGRGRAVAVARHGDAGMAVGASMALSPDHEGPDRATMKESDRWPRVKEIFHSALARAPHERGAFTQGMSRRLSAQRRRGVAPCRAC